MQNPKNALNSRISNIDTTIQNLEILYEGWEKIEQEPKMNDYGAIHGKPAEALKINETNICGASCCALGKAPEFKGLEIQESDFRDNKFNYSRYANRIFPYMDRLKNGGDNSLVFLRRRYTFWGFVFGPNWNNDRHALLNRIRYMIEHLQLLKKIVELTKTCAANLTH